MVKIQHVNYVKNRINIKYCNEDNCYTTASFNFKIDDRPIKYKKHKENNMINVKRKYIVNNNTKIIYEKGYICENKKWGSIKITKCKNNSKKSKNNKNITNSKKSNLVLLNPYNRPIDIENKFMRKKELTDKEIEREFSNLTLNSDIHDWYKNEDDELYYDKDYINSDITRMKLRYYPTPCFM